MFCEIGVGRDEVISRADFRKLAGVAARPACASACGIQTALRRKRVDVVILPAHEALAHSVIFQCPSNQLRLKLHAGAYLLMLLMRRLKVLFLA